VKREYMTIQQNAQGTNPWAFLSYISPISSAMSLPSSPWLILV
jgi:hypothetical protein